MRLAFAWQMQTSAIYEIRRINQVGLAPVLYPSKPASMADPTGRQSEDPLLHIQNPSISCFQAVALTMR